MVSMRSWSAKWPNIVTTWLEHPPKMEAGGGVRALVFRSCFVLEGLLAPRGTKRGPRGPKRAPRVTFGRILGGFELVLGRFWENSGMVLGNFFDGSSDLEQSKSS